MQVWDENNMNIFSHREQRFTSEGLHIYWKAVDRTIAYANQRLIREVMRNETAQLRNPDNNAKLQKAAQEEPTRKVFWDRSRDDRYKWTNKDKKYKLPHPDSHRRY